MNKFTSMRIPNFDSKVINSSDNKLIVCTPANHRNTILGNVILFIWQHWPVTENMHCIFYTQLIAELPGESGTRRDELTKNYSSTGIYKLHPWLVLLQFNFRTDGQFRLKEKKTTLLVDN
jgi:hypothetical protein